MSCTIEFIGGFWYSIFFTCTFEGAKLLAASMSAVERYKSSAHISFLSKIIQLNMNEVHV